jgi:hypothetical protein
MSPFHFYFIYFFLFLCHGFFLELRQGHGVTKRTLTRWPKRKVLQRKASEARGLHPGPVEQQRQLTKHHRENGRVLSACKKGHRPITGGDCDMCRLIGGTTHFSLEGGKERPGRPPSRCWALELHRNKSSWSPGYIRCG